MEFEMLASGYGLLEAPRVSMSSDGSISATFRTAESIGEIPVATSKR